MEGNTMPTIKKHSQMHRRIGSLLYEPEKN